MYYSIRTGNDGIGLDFPFGVFADDMREARVEAAQSLRNAGYALQADKGLFTVHGHSAWSLDADGTGYRIVPNSPTARPSVPFTIVNIDARAYAQRIEDYTMNRPVLTDAEKAQLDQDIEETCDRMLEDIRIMRGDASDKEI